MASTSSHNISSSASALNPTRWDVFLSFYGSDTRRSFTSHLYSALDQSGIRIFRDDLELEKGEEISSSLLKAVRESKIYVVVFSKNYASSSWCLQELAEILECYHTEAKLIVPVFYNINPSDVRHQRGSFGEALEKHEYRFVGDKGRVNKWRAALKEVADLSGYHVNENRSEADTINEIAKSLQLKLIPKTLDVAKYPVGIDSRVKDITRLLNSTATEGVITLGLYGMGGVGKTTLAKSLYNQNFHHFDGSCFLENVGMVSQEPNGRESLQQQLIADVLRVKQYKVHNVDQGKELIRETICSKKVLIVIDDIDHQNQLEFLVGPFASGSMIIITTRNGNILDAVDVNLRYKLNGLDAAESLELFTLQAFGKAQPSINFMELSKMFVDYAGGIPLALKVLGSSLFNRPEEYWRAKLKKIQKFSSSDIQKVLKITFDELGSDDLKNMFLDIVCFFIGYKKEDVVKILKTCYRYVDHNIHTLIGRCLLSINDENQLVVHDLIRIMGREISRNDSHDPANHSRLWALDDILDVLMEDVATEVIQGIIPDGRSYNGKFSAVKVATSTFKRMHKLRFLYLEDLSITGSFEQTFVDLTWFHWSKCPLQMLPSDFYPQQLVILELPHSSINRWDLTMVLKHLTMLDLSHSCELTTTPDFNRLPSLETLYLRGCVRLMEIHMSIGNLASLVFLDLNNCKNLRSLPDNICNLKALKSLDILGCHNLKALPMGLKSIKSLKELKARGHNISELPDSKGDLARLVKLFR